MMTCQGHTRARSSMLAARVVLGAPRAAAPFQRRAPAQRAARMATSAAAMAKARPARAPAALDPRAGARDALLRASSAPRGGSK